MGIIEQIAIFLILGFVFSTLSIMKELIVNPSMITRYEDGKVNWKWCLYKSATFIITSTLAATLVGVIVVPMVYPELEMIYRYGLACVAAIVGNEIWDILGSKARNFVKKWISDESGSEDKDSKGRKGRRR